MNPDAVEKLKELAVKESANQPSGETQKKRSAKASASASQKRKKRGRSKSYTSPTLHRRQKRQSVEMVR
jgi:hypothetical protein